MKPPLGASPYVVKDEGGKRMLIIDCRDAPYIPSFADDRNARFQVLRTLTEVEADLVVLAEVYERVYDENQTKMLAEIAALYVKFEVEGIWSYSHLGDPKLEQEKDFGERHNSLVRITHDELLFDPIQAYLLVLKETEREKARLQSLPKEAQATIYFRTLLDVKAAFEATKFIQSARAVLSKLENVPDTNQLYRAFFEAQVKPSFIGSRLVFGDEEKLELLDEYAVKDANVQIFKHPNKTEKLYFINLPEYSLTPEKYFLVSKTREVVATYAPGKASLSNIAKSRRYFERVYQSTMKDIARREKIELSNEDIVGLSQVVARYSVGYGVLEVLLSDRRITDIYIDAPIGDKLIYLVHSEWGQCQTNIIFTQDEADSFVSKIRAMSGRPFDEAHPILDFDLPDLDTRIAAISRPLSPDGTAFAFRLHKTTPWTLAQFIDVKYISPLAAGLLTFFIDSQATMLVTGSRGSGKTSLMSGLMLEILQNSRIITSEDSVAADSSIMVEREGKISRTTVGELIDGLIEKYGCEKFNGVEVLPANVEGIKVFSMDKKGKTALAPPSQFSRHKVSKGIYEIATRTGRKIKVTGDHSLFGLVENKISAIKCASLEEGSYIAVPRSIPWGDKKLEEFDLIQKIQELGEGFLCGPEIKKFANQNFKLLTKAARERGYSKSAPSAWKKNSVIPISLFREFSDKIGKDAMFFKLGGHSKPIPCKIKVTDNFLNIVGLWLADGSYDNKHAVIISTPDCKEEISRFAKSFGLNVKNHSDGFSYIISGVSLVFFFKTILGLEGNAYTKKFPPWVYSLSKDQLGGLLKGLYSGDGYNAEYEVAISLCSKELISSLQELLSAFGIVARLNKEDKKDKTISCRISGVKMVQSFAQNIAFLQERKNVKLAEICQRVSTHATSDIIPFSVQDKRVLSGIFENFNSTDYIKRGNSVGLEKFRSMVSKSAVSSELIENLKVLSEADVFWDEIKTVKNIGATEQYVYDFSVPGSESFIVNGIVAHNTLELPVEYMKGIGFNVQRLKTRSPIGTSENDNEVAPENALRTALRLGDSALVIGEVRSVEAKVLYEAMRVGAAGNIVMGTIHGDSAYSVWDRIVNDLDVPNTSFKATDVVVVARPIRFKGSIERHRRVVQITEVKKHWKEDPEEEGGLLDLMSYNAKKDELQFIEDNLKESDLFTRISSTTGLSLEELWKGIRMGAESKSHLVALKNEFKIPELLEAENTVIANNKLVLIKEEQLEEFGSVDYEEALGKWKNWVRTYLVKRVQGRTK